MEYFADEDEKSGEEKEEKNGDDKDVKMKDESDNNSEEKSDKKQKEKVTQKKGGKKKSESENYESEQDKSGPLELLSEDSQESAKPVGKKHYFVKFKSLQYDEATWEDAEFVEREYQEL